MAWKQTSDEYMELRALILTVRATQKCEHACKMSSIQSVLKQTLNVDCCIPKSLRDSFSSLISTFLALQWLWQINVWWLTVSAQMKEAGLIKNVVWALGLGYMGRHVGRGDTNRRTEPFLTPANLSYTNLSQITIKAHIEIFFFFQIYIYILTFLYCCPTLAHPQL